MSVGVGSLVLSPLLNRSTKIWYQITSFDHAGGSLNGVLDCALELNEFKKNNRNKKVAFALIAYFFSKNNRGISRRLFHAFSEWFSPGKNFVIQFLAVYPFAFITSSAFFCKGG